MRRLLATAAIVALLAVPVPATAAGPGMSVDVVAAHVVARGVLVDVEVIFTCEAMPTLEPPLWSVFEETYIDVTIAQRIGKDRATGNAPLYFGGDDLCTGEPQTAVVHVPADAGRVHFKAGPAAISVEGRASYSLWDGEYGSDPPIAFVIQEDATGWIEVRLGK